MAFLSNYERIQQALHTEMVAGPFYGIATDKDTKLKTVDGDTPITPASILVDDEPGATTFGPPLRNRRTNRLERRTWRWKAACRFNENVTAEALEKRLIETPVILPRDSVNDLEQVTLKLLDADPFHPPQQNPSSGAQVTLTFEAELAPV